MLPKIFTFVVLIFLCFGGTKVVLCDEDEHFNLCQNLSAIMSAEFANQREELSQLVAYVKAEKAELNIIQKEVLEQKEQIQNFIIEFSKQHQIYQENIKIQQEAAFSQIIAEHLQKFSEPILKSLKNQEVAHKEYLQNAVNAIVPRQQVSLEYDDHFDCTKNCGHTLDLPHSCDEAMSTEFHKDGIYLIKLKNSELKPFYVNCKRINGEIWTVIQRREDGSVDFGRNWADYKQGFGNLYGEYWLGLERLNVMTANSPHELYIVMESNNGTSAFAHYQRFSINSEAAKYRLTYSGYEGNAGDSFTSKQDNETHNGMKFSTHDNSNDNAKYISCARTYTGGWWFNACYNSHLNGRYKSDNGQNIDWNSFDKKLKYVEMSIRSIDI